MLKRWMIAGSCLAVVFAASAETLTLQAVTQSTQVSIAPYADGDNGNEYVLVIWEGHEIEPKSGAMIYLREDGATERHFLAVGGNGYFSLTDRHRSTLVNGTATPVYRMVDRDPSHPVEMRVVLDKHPDAAALKTNYLSHQGMVAASASKADVEGAFEKAGKAFRDSCGIKPGFQPQWAGFSSAGRTGLASAAAAAALGIAGKCVDAAYKAEISKFRSFKVRYDASMKPSDISFKRSGSEIEVVVGNDVMNPRERAQFWIAQEL